MCVCIISGNTKHNVTVQGSFLLDVVIEAKLGDDLRTEQLLPKRPGAHWHTPFTSHIDGGMQVDASQK
eukprot:4897661-Amphidinium_carterae.2